MQVKGKGPDSANHLGTGKADGLTHLCKILEDWSLHFHVLRSMPTAHVCTGNFHLHVKLSVLAVRFSPRLCLRANIFFKVKAKIGQTVNR